MLCEQNKGLDEEQLTDVINGGCHKMNITKKAVIITCAISILWVQACLAYCVNSEINTLEELGIIDDASISFNPVTREECLVAVLRVIGVTDDYISTLGGADYITFADTSSYSYFGIAFFNKIAYGEEIVVDFPTERTRHTFKNTDYFFFPHKNATINECLAFMVRCLIDDKNDDLNSVIINAKTIGLINEKDSFINKLDSELEKCDFIILLERFLQQRRFRYFDKLESVDGMKLVADSERRKTYLDFLNQRLQNNVN